MKGPVAARRLEQALWRLGVPSILRLRAEADGVWAPNTAERPAADMSAE